MLRILDHLEEWLITFLIGAATLFIFVAVVHRYSLDMAADWGWDAIYDWLFAINLSWAQELCIYMFVWMAKFGAAYGVRTGIHVGVDVLIINLKEWAARQVRPLRPAGRGTLHRDDRDLRGQLRLGERPITGYLPPWVSRSRDPEGRPPRTWKCPCGSSIWRSRSAPF